MSYSDFTLKDIKNRFGITVEENTSLFVKIKSCLPPDWLVQLLDNWVPLAHAIGTEKARSEFIIAPILAGVKELLNGKISLFSGISFNVDQAQGLNGICDFILSQSPEQLDLSVPIVTIVEAKNENIGAGIPQCMAEMIAASLFNEREGNPIWPLYGCVTTGSQWKFLQYEPEKQIAVDRDDYFIRQLDKILGIFLNFLQ
jgi:hypothetical protein